MKYIYIIISAAIPLCMSSCRHGHSASDVLDETVFDISSVEQQDTVLEAEQYEVVPLETNKECMLREVYKVLVRDSDIFVLDRDPNPRICVFDQQGKFKNTIGELGHGKNEYVDVDNFAVSERGDSVFLLCNNILKIFKKDGSYLTTVGIEDEYTWDDIICTRSGLMFASYHHIYDHLISEWNFSWKEIATYIQYPHDLIKGGVWSIHLLQQDKTCVCFLDPFGSIFYIIDKDTKRISSFSLKSDKMMTLEDSPDKALMDGKHDLVNKYVYADGVIRGYLDLHGRIRSFSIDTRQKVFSTFNVSQAHFGADAYHNGWFYSVVDRNYLRMSDLYNPYRPNESHKRFHDAIIECLDTITANDNYLVLKVKIAEANK